MWHFQKIDPLIFLSDFRFITFVGSGGKTTFMELCAAELLRKGKSVAVTTTTRIYAKEPYILLDDAFDWSKNSGFMRIGKTLADGKLAGLEFDEVERLGKLYDVVLVEADGAKGKPLKFPADYEPVIPPFSEKICVLCGLDAFFGEIKDKVFRWELFHRATGLKGTDIISPQVFLQFFSEDALLKNVNINRCTIILNKYDALNSRKTALDIAKQIISTTTVQEIIVSSAFFNVFYLLSKA